MKATDLLKKQHKQVKALFKKVDKTENPRERRQALPKNHGHAPQPMIPPKKSAQSQARTSYE